VGEEPAADNRLGQPSAFFAGGGGSKIAQPGETLKLLGERSRGPDVRNREPSATAFAPRQ